MDKFTRQVLASTGLLGMIGKAERGPEAIAAIREFHSVYLITVGGAAYLISKAIQSARVLAFADLGMEAIYEFEVVDMPVTWLHGGHFSLVTVVLIYDSLSCIDEGMLWPEIGMSPLAFGELHQATLSRRNATTLCGQYARR
jgi:hypothetical protein